MMKQALKIRFLLTEQTSLDAMQSIMLTITR